MLEKLCAALVLVVTTSQGPTVAVTGPLAGDLPSFRAPEELPHQPSDEDAAADDPAAPEPAAPLALREAIALALMRNPELAAFSWRTREAEARALQSGTIPNPELDLRLYRLGIPRGSVEPDQARTRIVLSQVFEMGGKRRRRVDLARTESALADWDYEQQRLRVATVVAGRFVEVLGAQRRVATLGEHVAFVERVRDRIATLVRTGAMRNVEVQRIASRLGLARIDLQRSEFDMAAARRNLALMWAAEAPSFTRAEGDLEQTRPLPDIDSVLDMADEGPAIARWDSEMARSRAALSLARSRRIPDINYGVGVRWEDDFDRKDYLIDLEFTLPVFDRRKGEIREARYAVERARASREAARVARTEAVTEFYYGLAEAAARVRTLGNDVLPAAQATFEGFRVGFETQSDLLGDLLGARSNLTDAEVLLTEALVDYHVALASLENIVGRSLDMP